MGGAGARERTVISIKCDPAYRDWINRLASRLRLKAVDAIDLALVEYAERHGFDEPPPARNPKGGGTS